MGLACSFSTGTGSRTCLTALLLLSRQRDGQGRAGPVQDGDVATELLVQALPAFRCAGNVVVVGLMVVLCPGVERVSGLAASDETGQAAAAAVNQMTTCGEREAGHGQAVPGSLIEDRESGVSVIGEGSNSGLPDPSRIDQQGIR